MSLDRFAVGLLALLVLTVEVRADIIGTFDENGNGTSFYTVTMDTAILPGANGVDPFDPGNGLRPLIYDLGIQLPMVDGDIVVTDPGSSVVSDIFRFYTDTSTNLNLLIMYSQVENGGSLADVGIPTSRQGNLLTLTEMSSAGGSSGIFGYTPTSSQPGYVDIQAGHFVGNLVYNLISDSVVPEPSSILLLGIGLAAVAGVRLLNRPRGRPEFSQF